MTVNSTDILCQP